jgi:hypothetical protein
MITTEHSSIFRLLTKESMLLTSATFLGKKHTRVKQVKTDKQSDTPKTKTRKLLRNFGTGNNNTQREKVKITLVSLSYNCIFLSILNLNPLLFSDFLLPLKNPRSRRIELTTLYFLISLPLNMSAKVDITELLPPLYLFLSSSVKVKW